MSTIGCVLSSEPSLGLVVSRKLCAMPSLSSLTEPKEVRRTRLEDLERDSDGSLCLLSLSDV
jgi:hypothetical protein